MDHLRTLIESFKESFPPCGEDDTNALEFSQEEMLSKFLPFLDDDFSRESFTRIMIECGYRTRYSSSSCEIVWLVEANVSLPGS